MLSDGQLSASTMNYLAQYYSEIKDRDDRERPVRSNSVVNRLTSKLVENAQASIKLEGNANHAK